jgi:hypothetical protein
VQRRGVDDLVGRLLVCCPVGNSEKIAKVGISAETGAFSPV